ncbi:MAG TPA: alkaline phosphatase family protein [Candidatus Limnocylindrales bacterium]|nr:alkaline phosphatase family protein [Candidatus Limnocylindrales bacterium]
MKRTAVIDVVGLSESLLGPQTPRISAFIKQGAACRIRPAFPAVTCTAQANYLTGASPARHGIVGNGWYNRELAEVHFWEQSNYLVSEAKIWDTLREAEPSFTCAQLFWWFNMYSRVDWSITPRPIYPADGRKIFDIYSWPYSIRSEIKRDLGEFPFPAFWGPAAGVNTPQGPADAVSRWIAKSAEWIEQRFSPSLNLVYLPHLDYNLQRYGPRHPAIATDLELIDQIVGELIDFFQNRSVQVVVLSEYGISAVDTPVHLNRLFRKQGWLSLKDELGKELIDFGASKVFAVADHQVAHIYCNDRSLEKAVRTVLEKQPGVDELLDAEAKRVRGLDHPRAGDLIAVAAEGAWFTYYYWEDDQCAPDFARTVDIHRKPGYDPVELFLDPAQPFVKARIAWRLLQKRLGFRMLLDVIPLDASLVKGSHGRIPASEQEWPLLITSDSDLAKKAIIDSTEVFGLLVASSQ